MSDLLGRAIREVVDLHQFFEDWFTGRLPQTEEAFQRFPLVTAPEFALIGPDGAARTRAQVLEWVWSIHGARPTTRMWIEDVRVAVVRPSLYLVTYDEWQADADSRSVRVSSALFEDSAGAPNGLNWLHVHETWKGRQG